MIIKKRGFGILAGLLVISIITSGQTINIKNIRKVRLKMYEAEGLVWKGESAQNTSWNKIICRLRTRQSKFIIF